MATECVTVHRGGKCKSKSKRKESKPREVLRSTDGKANFHRCTRLLIGGGTALLKEKFDQLCPPSVLPKILADPKTKHLLKKAKLTTPQWERLYPSRNSFGVSEDFDISLLFPLLTTITEIPVPDLGRSGWPRSKDVSLGADLARIKYYRNVVYGHVNQEMSLEEEDFHYYWDNIKNTLIRIAESISREKKREWKKEIENFKSKPLTADEERYAEELERWTEEDTETKERLRKLEDSVETLKEGLNELKEMLHSCKVCGDPKCRQEDHKGIALLPIHLDCPQIGSKRKRQEFLSSAKERYIEIYNPSTRKGKKKFSHFMEAIEKVFIVGTKEGSLIIIVGCRSVQVLDGLWNDFREGHLSEMAQKYLVTDEILKEFGLSEVKLTTDISEEEYRRCRRDLELYSEIEQKLAVVKDLRDGLQEKFLAWARMRESNITLLGEFLTQLRGFPPGRAGAMAAFVGGVVAVLTSVPVLVGAAAAAGVGAAGVLVSKWDMQRKAKEEIIKERKVFDELQLKADSLKQPLAGLADFCQENTDSVLSSRHLEGEFHLLSRMLQKQEPEDLECTEGLTLPNFIKDEVEKHYTSIRQPLERLSTSQTDEEISEKISRILEKLKVGPGEQEIRAMISSFIEKEFAAYFFRESNKF